LTSDWRLQIKDLRPRDHQRVAILNLKATSAPQKRLLLRRIGGRRWFRDFVRGLLLHRLLPGSFSPLPLLVAAVMRLLVGRLFLHPPIMSQIPHVIPAHVAMLKRRRSPFDFAMAKIPLLAPRTREKWGTRPASMKRAWKTRLQIARPLVMLSEERTARSATRSQSKHPYIQLISC
jgi:hypothetical protein